MENNAANNERLQCTSLNLCRSGSQHVKKAVIALERVQKRATGMIKGTTEWFPCEGRLRCRLCFLSFGKR